MRPLFRSFGCCSLSLSTPGASKWEKKHRGFYSETVSCASTKAFFLCAIFPLGLVASAATKWVSHTDHKARYSQMQSRENCLSHWLAVRLFYSLVFVCLCCHSMQCLHVRVPAGVGRATKAQTRQTLIDSLNFFFHLCTI